MRKIKKLLPFVLSLMLLSSCETPGSSSLGYRQISMDKAVKMMKDEKNYITKTSSRSPSLNHI